MIQPEEVLYTLLVVVAVVVRKTEEYYREPEVLVVVEMVVKYKIQLTMGILIQEVVQVLEICGDKEVLIQVVQEVQVVQE